MSPNMVAAQHSRRGGSERNPRPAGPVARPSTSVLVCRRATPFVLILPSPFSRSRSEHRAQFCAAVSRLRLASCTPGVSSNGRMFHPPDTNGTDGTVLEEKTAAGGDALSWPVASSKPEQLGDGGRTPGNGAYLRPETAARPRAGGDSWQPTRRSARTAWSRW